VANNIILNTHKSRAFKMHAAFWSRDLFNPFHIVLGASFFRNYFISRYPWQRHVIFNAESTRGGNRIAVSVITQTLTLFKAGTKLQLGYLEVTVQEKLRSGWPSPFVKDEGCCD
jgi:hypothetical protein